MRFTKTFLSGVTALALLAGPALAQPAPGQWPNQHQQGPGGQPPHDQGHPPQGNMAQNDNHNDNHNDYHSNNNYHHGPSGPNGHWARGDYYSGHRVVIGHGDWNRYHLHAPPPGYEWVQSGGQFVMIAIASGVIASIIAGSAY